MTLLSRGVKVHLAFGFIDMRKGQPPRRTVAVELATNKPRGLSHVQGMEAYD
jgi:hypothetical protein